MSPSPFDELPPGERELTEIARAVCLVSRQGCMTPLLMDIAKPSLRPAPQAAKPRDTRVRIA